MRSGWRGVGDERGLLVKSAILLLVFVAILAVAGLDTFSILRARYSVSDTADVAATEAAFSYREAHDVEDACAVAVEIVAKADKEARVPRQGCVIDRETAEVTITVRKEANTLVAKRVDFLVEYTKAESTSSVSAMP